MVGQRLSIQEATVAERPTSTLLAPYGGELIDLVAAAEAIDELQVYANRLSSLQLSERSVCDLGCSRRAPFPRLTASWDRGITSAYWMRCV